MRESKITRLDVGKRKKPCSSDTYRFTFFPFREGPLRMQTQAKKDKDKHPDPNQLLLFDIFPNDANKKESKKPTE